MIGLDANTLLRYIIRDDSHQAKLSDKLIDYNIANGEDFFINNVVLYEIFWVMKNIYKLTKLQILENFEALLETIGIIIENEDAVNSALEIYRDNNIDFSDAFISMINLQNNVSYTATFDKNAAKNINGFRLVESFKP